MTSLLLIEDDLNAARLVEKLLTPCGFVVHHAENGLFGLRYVREHTIAIDMVLVDMDLPDLDGKHVVLQLRGIFAARRLPIVAFTAHDSERARWLAAQIGCDGYLTKPIDTRTFVEEVRAFLREAPLTISIDDSEDDDSKGKD